MALLAEQLRQGAAERELVALGAGSTEQGGGWWCCGGGRVAVAGGGVGTTHHESWGLYSDGAAPECEWAQSQGRLLADAAAAAARCGGGGGGGEEGCPAGKRPFQRSARTFTGLGRTLADRRSSPLAGLVCLGLKAGLAGPEGATEPQGRGELPGRSARPARGLPAPPSPPTAPPPPLLPAAGGAPCRCPRCSAWPRPC